MAIGYLGTNIADDMERINQEAEERKIKEERKKKQTVSKNIKQIDEYVTQKKAEEEEKAKANWLNSLDTPKWSLRPATIAKTFNDINDVLASKDSKNSKFTESVKQNDSMPIPDMQTDESSSDEKSSSGTKSSTPNVGNSAPKSTSGRTSPRRNTSRGEYADLENSGKTKAWYESLANSSYANDKAYEADMKAFRKMQADEIAKNGYYTDSQGVKVYAKAMTDKPKKENNNE